MSTVQQRIKSYPQLVSLEFPQKAESYVQKLGKIAIDNIAPYVLRLRLEGDSIHIEHDEDAIALQSKFYSAKAGAYIENWGVSYLKLVEVAREIQTLLKTYGINSRPINHVFNNGWAKIDVRLESDTQDKIYAINDELNLARQPENLKKIGE